VDHAHPKLAEPLADIAGISRELVDSMSDIVWAIDPERDHMEDLVHRMRRFASDVLSPRDIRLAFQPPPEEQDLPMGADLRRQIFLIFKEAVHNVLRHSGATEVTVDFRVEHGWLSLRVADNGGGFDDARVHDGHGLRSMRERARELAAEIEIHSGPGGTNITLRVPLARRPAPLARSPHE
jgi:signal transduction histidine kinase